ncbi:putative F-box domain, leucine-rich repeat domain, L domain-containing protein [Medicago truncatula]|uniref:F-box/RNI/FBD-like domain protein n=1 Tax=Medicago truncatula TaxID=3880 RepID=G7IW41_MEDTR|nr:F-box/RNI/FBD-like domain protein [Medicago truncatula]RHN65830.1 putative F-box domain, leucine-rich repeat domain, L domain-containing protein [Medicago truncatula]
MIFPLEPNTERITTNPNRNIENNEDRLSDLPDSILHHILSLLDTKQAFQTSILSTRWKNLPKHLSTLRLSSTVFYSFDSFMKSVSRILSHRDDLTSLHTLDLYNRHTHYFDFVDPDIFKSIVNCAEPFSALSKLNTLIIRQFRVLDAQTLCISNTTLVNFTMETYYDYKDIRKLELFTPSLTNFSFTGTPNLILSVSHPCSITHLYVNAEDIVGFVKEDSAVLLSWLLELANIKSLTVSSNTLQVLRLLYLYMCGSLVACISLFISKFFLKCRTVHISFNRFSIVPDFFKVKLTSLCNLESLQVEMKPLTPGLYKILSFRKFKKTRAGIRLKKDKFIPYGVVEFLLQNSPLAKINIIDNDD